MNSRQDDANTIKQANARMCQAWADGKEVLDRLGARASYREMQRESGGNASHAERLRKYRSMASRLTEAEVAEICVQCQNASRAWGPQFLIEVSRLPTKSERRRAVKLALQTGWGLIEVKRHVRVRLAELGKTPRQARGQIGRRRKLAWNSPGEIADQVERMCTTWLRFQGELERAAEEAGISDWRDLLPEQHRRLFPRTTKLIAKMHDE